MPSQSFELGTVVAGTYAFSVNTEINANLLELETPAYLRLVDFDQAGAGTFVISTDTDGTTAAGDLAGPSFRTSVELYDRALQLRSTSENTQNIAGPNNPANVLQDDTAQYAYTPANFTDVRTWIDAEAGETITLVLTDGLPDAPAIPVEESSFDTRVVISWIEPAEGDAAILGYPLRARPTDSDDWTDKIATTTPYDFMELMPGTQYEFQVRAENTHGLGDWSASGYIATKLTLYATELKNNELMDYRTEWDKNITYKVHNNGKVLLLFNHTNTTPVILDMITQQEVKGRGGRMLDIQDDDDVSEIVEHPVKGAFDPSVYNDDYSMLWFKVRKVSDDDLPIDNVSIALVRYP